MAPEILEIKPYTAKVDIWSIGVIFFELLTLTHPFLKDEKQSQLITKNAILKDSP